MSNEQEATGLAGPTVDHGFQQGERSTPVHRTVDHASVSMTVVEALAEAQGVSPLDIREPLYDAVDPDALDSLFDGTDAELDGGRVVFSTAGFEVTVTARGDVYVHDA